MSMGNMLTESKKLLTAVLILGLSGCNPADTAGGGEKTAMASEPAATEAETASYDNDISKASYSLGFTVAKNVEQSFADSVEVTPFVQGVRDGFGGKERAVSVEDAQASLEAMSQAQQTASAARAGDNLSAGAAFMSENGVREGVETLPSGLQYEILVAAEGDMPGATDTVTTHYHGTLIDGTVFDSSYDRGQPASFPLNGVIPGWTEALQLMAVGAKWRLYVPPELAYGPQDRGPIPGNSTLVFEVELLEIQSAE